MLDFGISGGGLFTHLSPTRRLSAEGRSRSWWRLPRWFYPGDGRPGLSYHGDPARWRLEPASTLLRVVAKGQEFVLDGAHYPEATGWLHAIFHEARGFPRARQREKAGADYINRTILPADGTPVSLTRNRR